MSLYELPFILYLSIPLTAGLIGWLTNILALRMTFYPLNYIGIRPFGWQGIVPSKTQKIAEKSVDLLTTKLLNIEEPFQKLDTSEILNIISPSLDTLTHQLTDEVMEAQYSFYWNNISQQRKAQWVESFQAEFRLIISQILKQIKEEIKLLLDIKALSMAILTKNKTLLNQVFWRCGQKEFRFIERSGIYFGIPLGTLQLPLLLYFPSWWVLPLFGLILGYCTNWLAIRLIFRPLKPKKLLFGKVKVQGLFLKRQQEVSHEYAQIISREILSTERILEFIIRGPKEPYMRKILENHILCFLENIATQKKINTMPSHKRYVIKNILVYRLKQELPLLMQNLHSYIETSFNLEEELRQKMTALPPEEFEKFLRPAFQEDEWILIWVGSLLGFLAGVLQYWALF